MTLLDRLRMPLIKVCGVCTIADARMSRDAGATAIGLNFWPASPRSIDFERAEQIMRSMRDEPLAQAIDFVAVCVDPTTELLNRLRGLGLDAVQIHLRGQQSAAPTASEDGPPRFFAVGIDNENDSRVALRTPGEVVLVDAKHRQLLGGSGKTAPWDLAADLARQRPTILAGGLGGDNVAAAIARVRPLGVDAASRIEDSPGKKNESAVRAFVRQAQLAFAALAPNSKGPTKSEEASVAGDQKV